MKFHFRKKKTCGKSQVPTSIMLTPSSSHHLLLIVNETVKREWSMLNVTLQLLNIASSEIEAINNDVHKKPCLNTLLKTLLFASGSTL